MTESNTERVYGGDVTEADISRGTIKAFFAKAGIEPSKLR